MRKILIVVGILLATIGGVIAYRALYLEPSSTLVITNTSVSEGPNYGRVIGGAFLLVFGVALAFFGIRKRSSRTGALR